jgi:hypothetical protein
LSLFKEMRKMRKDAKALQKEASGGKSSFGMLRETMHQAPGMMAEGLTAMRQMQTDNADSQRVVTSGIDATSTFVAARETGIAVGGEGFEQPLAEIDLDVSVPGQPTARTTIRQVIPRLSFGRLVPGAVFPVKVDPMDHSKVVILWDAPPPGAQGTGAPPVTTF